MESTKLIRLNKYIADAGISSRRKADTLIRMGHVRINGKTIRELGYKIDPKVDEVVVKGKPIRTSTKDRVYILFHKPLHVITTMDDPEGRTTVADFFKHLKTRVFPVGRLDFDSEGLLLLTNDGDFAQAVAHPKEEIPKTYMVKLGGQPSPELLNRLKLGVVIPGGRVRALEVEKIRRKSELYDWVRIVIDEGKNRQIRHMFEKIGIDVKKLRRVAIGGLKLGSLPKGHFEFISQGEAFKVFAVKKKTVEQQKIRKRPTSTKRNPHKKPRNLFD